MKNRLTTAMGFLAASATLPMAVVYGTDGTLPFAVQAPLLTTAPVLDGAIGAGEYGFMIPVSFAAGTNPGEIFPALAETWFDDPTDANLSLNFYLGHDATNIYFGFEVTDNFIENEDDAEVPWRNDGVELTINGDGVANDTAPAVSAEGFRYIADSAGNFFNVGSAGLTSAASETTVGYDIEIVVPLASIDTIDGAGVANPTTGDTLKFNFSVTDNDTALTSAQDNVFLFWNLDDTVPSQNEGMVVVDLELTAAAGQDGDFDDDLDVDGADFLEWQRSLGDPTNLALWEANFGTPAPLTATLVTVPEPASVVLLIAYGLLMAAGGGPYRRAIG